MEKEIVFVLLDEFADWEAAFLAPALCLAACSTSASVALGLPMRIFSRILRLNR